MAPRFVSIDRDSPLLLPPNLRDRVPADHLVHFIVDAVAALDLRQVKVNERGTGSEPYPPTMLLALLIYSYATGTFGSRRIEQSTYDSVPVRRLTADTHPDHDPICTFRRENKALLTESFVQVLQLAVEQLVAKAEVADSAPLQDGLSIPAARNAKPHWKRRAPRSKPAPRRATPSSWLNTKRKWPGAPPGKNAVSELAANHPKPRRPSLIPATNTTLPIRRAGS